MQNYLYYIYYIFIEGSMRIALISDSHTKENIEIILEYLRKKAFSWKIKLIIINGDILGENEVRETYGYKYNKKLFHASLDKDKVLKEICSGNYDALKEFAKLYEQGIKDEKAELEFSKQIMEYVTTRYNYLFNILTKFSTIAKTYFNVGTYESPLQYNVLKELAFLLDIKEPYIRRIALLSNYREIFKEFLVRIKDPKLKKLKYIGGTTSLEGDVLITGIPGLNPSSRQEDKLSEFQEKITSDLMNTIRRQLSYTNKLIMLNQTQGRLRKDPFAFRPSSYSVRSFIEEVKGKLRQKVFVQSYHHFMTTHFYFASEFYFLLNNAAVNNGLFNILDLSTKVHCYDVDPSKDRVKKLKPYNHNLVDYSTPEERLALNYEDSKEIIKEREIKGCYYM